MARPVDLLASTRNLGNLCETGEHDDDRREDNHELFTCITGGNLTIKIRDDRAGAIKDVVML